LCAFCRKQREDRNGSPIKPRFLDAVDTEENNGSPLRSDSKKPATLPPTEHNTEYEADSMEEANAAKENEHELAAKEEVDDEYEYDDDELTAKEAEDEFAAEVDNDEFPAIEAEHENK